MVQMESIGIRHFSQLLVHSSCYSHVYAVFGSLLEGGDREIKNFLLSSYLVDRKKKA